MLGQSRRRWASIKSTLAQRSVFDGIRPVCPTVLLTFSVRFETFLTIFLITISQCEYTDLKENIDCTLYGVVVVFTDVIPENKIY